MPDRKVRKLMEEYQKTGRLLKASLRADLDSKPARAGTARDSEEVPQGREVAFSTEGGAHLAGTIGSV